jgi:leader peptidase (prepilin peptidase)/N-methyltransferase
MRLGVTVGLVLAWLAALSCYDIRTRRLPNALTLPGAGVILLAAGFAGRGLAIGLGGLAGCFGAGVWFLAALVAPLLTALLALGVRAGTGALTVPHGPSMCVATALAVGLVVV